MTEMHMPAFEISEEGVAPSTWIAKAIITIVWCTIWACTELLGR